MEFYKSGKDTYSLRPAETRAGESEVISFRLPRSDYVSLFPLVETFDRQSWAEAMRWLLSLDVVQDAISERVRGSAHGG